MTKIDRIKRWWKRWEAKVENRADGGLVIRVFDWRRWSISSIVIPFEDIPTVIEFLTTSDGDIEISNPSKQGYVFCVPSEIRLDMRDAMAKAMILQ